MLQTLLTRNLAQQAIPIWSLIPVSDHVFLQELSFDHYQALVQISPYPCYHFLPVWDEAVDYGKGKISDQSRVFGLGWFGHEDAKIACVDVPIVSGLDRRPRACQCLIFGRGTVIHTHLSKHRPSRDLSRPIMEQIREKNPTDTILVGDLNMERDELGERLDTVAKGQKTQIGSEVCQ